MYDLSQPEFRSPLYDRHLPGLAKPAGSGAGVFAAEITGRGYMNLRGNLADVKFSEAAKTALGGALPNEPCTMTSLAGIDILWLSPDEWLITGPRAAIQALLAKLQPALSGIRGLAADNSSGLTEIAVIGASADAVLSHCTVYDLHALTPGRVVGTTFGKVQTYLRRDGTGFRLIVRRSFADYVWRYLERASLPYGFSIAKTNSAHGHTS